MFSFWDKFCYILICSFPFSFRGRRRHSFLSLARRIKAATAYFRHGCRSSFGLIRRTRIVQVTLNKNHQAHPIRKAQEHAWLLQFLCWSQCFFLHDPSKSNKTNNVLYANGDHESTYFDEVLPSYILKNASSNALKRQPSVRLFN